MHSGLAKGINFIRLATPTTDERRLPTVLRNTSGFVYYVSMNGITGSALPDLSKIEEAVAAYQIPHRSAGLRWFWRKTADHAKAIGAAADGVVVGSAIVAQVAGSLTPDGKLRITPFSAVTRSSAAGQRRSHARLVAAEVR